MALNVYKKYGAVPKDLFPETESSKNTGAMNTQLRHLLHTAVAHMYADPASIDDEVAKTVRRVVDKLLHAPTVRVKQLASAPGGDSYAEALRELFELDQQAVDAVAASELPLVTGNEFGMATTDLDKTE